MINLEDLKDETAPRKGFRHTVVCDPELEAMLKDFKRAHGERKTAEVIRRALKHYLPIAAKKLRTKKHSD